MGSCFLLAHWIIYSAVFWCPIFLKTHQLFTPLFTWLWQFFNSGAVKGFFLFRFQQFWMYLIQLLFSVCRHSTYTSVLLSSHKFLVIKSKDRMLQSRFLTLPHPSSERVRHIALGKVHGPPYYNWVEQGIHPKRVGSQKAITCSRDKSWCLCQWPHSLPQPYNCHPHSEGLVWSYACSFPVRLELLSSY